MRVAGVFAHPDDEVLCAGVLAACAAAGAEVTVVCATRGEAGVARDGVPRSRDELGTLRARELGASCAALGARAELAGLPDGGLDASDGGAVLEILARRRPAVIVTLGGDGAYGHLDHLAVTRWVAQVRGPRVLHALFPRGVFAPVARALRRVPVVRLADVALGSERSAAELVIEPDRERKLAAARAHASQLAGGDPHTFIRDGVLAALLDEEWYAVAAGPALPPGARDALAGLS